MIEYRAGNIFDEDVEALVNPVNCVGVMGAGLAKQFRQRYPQNYTSYFQACRRGEMVPGHLHIYDIKDADKNPKYIINFPTKRHWKNKSRIEDIELGMSELTKQMKKLGINSIAIPALGAGLGGLKWFEVKKVIEKYVKTLPSKKFILLIGKE